MRNLYKNDIHTQKESFVGKKSQGTIKTIFLVVVCIIAMVMPVFGMGIQVQDDADLLSEEAEVQILSQLETAEAETGWDIIVLSIADAQGKTARVYAEDLYDENLVIEDGVSCVIDMDNREIALQTTGEAIFYLTDARIEDILDVAYVPVTTGDYEEAFSKMLDEVVACYNMGAKGNYAYDEETGAITKYRSLEFLEILVSLAMGLVICAAVGGGIIASYRMKFGGYKYSPFGNSRIRLTAEVDQYLRKNTTHRRIPRNNGGGGGGGRSSGGSSGCSSTRSSSSGRSHGGGSRKF